MFLCRSLSVSSNVYLIDTHPHTYAARHKHLFTICSVLCQHLPSLHRCPHITTDTCVSAWFHCCPLGCAVLHYVAPSMSVRSCHLKPDPSERASHSEETALLLNGAPDPIQECLDTHSPGVMSSFNLLLCADVYFIILRCV